MSMDVVGQEWVVAVNRTLRSDFDFARRWEYLSWKHGVTFGDVARDESDPDCVVEKRMVVNVHTR